MQLMPPATSYVCRLLAGVCRSKKRKYKKKTIKKRGTGADRTDEQGWKCIQLGNPWGRRTSGILMRRGSLAAVNRKDFASPVLWSLAEGA